MFSNTPCIVWILYEDAIHRDGTLLTTRMVSCIKHGTWCIHCHFGDSQTILSTSNIVGVQYGELQIILSASGRDFDLTG
jgi:hypothetical protein